jgi:hypothetical protein
MSPTAPRNVAAQMTFTPGTVINRRACSDRSASRAISRSTAAISESRNSTWRSALSSVAHQLLAAREPPAHHTTGLVGHPHRIQLARRQQPRHALPVTSSATRSSAPRLCANSSSRSGVL